MPNSAKNDLPLTEVNARIDSALVSCALEDIHPDQNTIEELKLLRTGRMSPDEFIAYIKEKYTQPE